MSPSTEDARHDLASGLAIAGTAYLIWGLAPIFWKQLTAVPPGQLLAHRVIWALVFLLLIQTVRRRWHLLIEAFANRRALLVIAATALLVACNWFTFIYAVLTDRILQTSLGYYMNPLVSIVLGVFFLGERMRALQLLAVVAAFAGVTWLALQGTAFPTLALVLAFSFGFYGLLRKTVSVGPLTAQTIETLYLAVPAIIYLVFVETTGHGYFAGADARGIALLIGTGLITAVPLLLFGIGVRMLSLVTIGFLQYLAPSISFLLGVFVYGEPFRSAEQVAFGLIWAALVLYTSESLVHNRRLARAQEGGRNSSSGTSASAGRSPGTAR